MESFNLREEQRFKPEERVEQVLSRVADGDQTIACWEPGHISPYHCHPFATEIYFCFEGGGVMHTPEGSVDIVPGSFVVHPPGELHEYVNGPERTLLFRVRYGPDVSSRTIAYRQLEDWEPNEQDLAYLREHPEAAALVGRS